MEKQKKQAELEAKNKELELENANKSEIEHLFLKLSDSEQAKYYNLANNILNKYAVRLKHSTIESLSYSIFCRLKWSLLWWKKKQKSLYLNF